jgi:transcriptional regulator with XRE-family HTH domain
MVDELMSFLNWLNGVMKERGISQADIARTGFVTTAAVSKLFTYQVKTVGVDMCKAIAAATNIPLVTIYRKAGHLPNIVLTDAEMDEIADLMSGITDPDLRQDAREQLMLLNKKQERRKNADTNIIPNPKAP